MTNKMTVKEATKTLQQHGVALKRTEFNEFRVNFKHGTEATAYYTDDLIDAVNTGIDMATRKAC